MSYDCFDPSGFLAECQVFQIVTVNNGHFAGRHELLHYGVELERRKADCGVCQQSVWNGSWHGCPNGHPGRRVQQRKAGAG